MVPLDPAPRLGPGQGRVLPLLPWTGHLSHNLCWVLALGMRMEIHDPHCPLRQGLCTGVQIKYLHDIDCLYLELLTFLRCKVLFLYLFQSLSPATHRSSAPHHSCSVLLQSSKVISSKWWFLWPRFNNRLLIGGEEKLWVPIGWYRTLAKYIELPLSILFN